MDENYFTGIGSRSIPDDIRLMMIKISSIACQFYILRSGYAVGSDQAFVEGCSGCCDIYNPNSNNNYLNDDLRIRSIDCSQLSNWSEAQRIAKQYHPAWNKLRPSSKDLITRNTYQILGDDLSTPSRFVICWTSDGAIHKTSITTGGTGQAIRLALDYGIPVFNLQYSDHKNLIQQMIDGVIDFDL